MRALLLAALILLAFVPMVAAEDSGAGAVPCGPVSRYWTGLPVFTYSQGGCTYVCVAEAASGFGWYGNCIGA